MWARARGRLARVRWSSWAVKASEPRLEALATRSIEEHGFVVIEDLFDKEELQRLTSPASEGASEVLRQLASKGVALGVGSREGFEEVCLRSPGRYDVPRGFDAFDAELLGRLERLCEGFVSQKAFAGLVRAQPGSEAQQWHADSPHVSKEHSEPHLLNVLVPTQSVTEDLGPTELLPGSHRLTNHLENKAFGSEILYQAADNGPEKIGSREEPVKATMEAGSVLIFDDRILHRGGHNRSQLDRDVAFFSYRQAGFEPSTHYESVRRLASYDHRQLHAVRVEFPGLRCSERPAPVLADGASGSQVHESVVDAMVAQLRLGIANIGGSYDSSRRAEAAVAGARSAMANFLGCQQEEIAFGPSMTALVFHLTRSLRNGGFFKPGDNVVLDPLSHGANVWPWLQAAEGLEVRWLPVHQELSRVALDSALEGVVDQRTRLVAMGAASNGVGTVHDVAELCRATRQRSQAWTFVDAVHYAPHGHLDVKRLGCDFLVCSPYKFFGPHAGVLYGRRELLASLSAERLDCSDNALPSAENGNMSRWELGTQNYEALAGVAAAVRYVAGLGERFGGAVPGATEAEKVETGFRAISAHEDELKRRMLEGLRGLPNVQLLGIADPKEVHLRTATFAVAKKGLEAQELAERLCARGVWCTAGNHYAGFWQKHAGNDGMARLGLLHYNTLEEVDRILSALEAA